MNSAQWSLSRLRSRGSLGGHGFPAFTAARLASRVATICLACDFVSSRRPAAPPRLPMCARYSRMFFCASVIPEQFNLHHKPLMMHGSPPVDLGGDLLQRRRRFLSCAAVRNRASSGSALALRAASTSRCHRGDSIASGSLEREAQSHSIAWSCCLLLRRETSSFNSRTLTERNHSSHRAGARELGASSEDGRPLGAANFELQPPTSDF
jgi:hypothetical protein